MRRSSFLRLGLALLLAAGVGAQSLPEPLWLGRSDHLSIMVARLRAEKPGLRQLILTAMAGDGQSSSGPSMATVLDGVLSQRSRQSIVLAALPLQWVRLDRADTRGRLLPVTALTLTGWKGLQSLAYNSMVLGDPSVKIHHHRGEAIYLRPGWQNPEEARVMTRARGTFLNCANLDLAREASDRLASPPSKKPSGPLWQTLATVSSEKDLYGAVINRQGVLLKLVLWAGGGVAGRVRDRFGPERFDRTASLVSQVTWEAEVVSDDRLELDLRFQTAGSQGVGELEQLWSEARQELSQEHRLGSLETSPLPGGIRVQLSVVGFRRYVAGFLESLRL